MSANAQHAAVPINSLKLAAPVRSGGNPLFVALQARRSSREFRDDELNAQTLSNFLWAAYDINRPDGHRTAPSVHNWQEIDIYVAMKRGLYLFDPGVFELRPVLVDDIRAATGTQDYVAEASADLVYVADLSRMETSDRTEQRFYSALDTGFIGQNVYLFCASEGLATVVRGLVDRKELARLMRLRPDQRIMVAQTVGYPRVAIS